MQSDAHEYLLTSKNSFDLIIVDIFVIDTIPDIFTQAEFLNKLKNHLNHKGYIIYNTMNLTIPTDMFYRMTNTFAADSNLIVKVFNDVEGTNNLIVVNKNYR